MDEALRVLWDAHLAGEAVAVARLGAQLAEQLGVAGVGADAHGPWLRLEVTSAPVWELPLVSHRLRWIWPGRFLMGSPEDEAGRFSCEGPQHEVELTRGLWLGETPVTQALWQAVMGDNPSRFVSPSRPVEQVRWRDCLRFCAHLGEQLPVLRPRLPTEAEWEHAARAGSSTATYAGALQLLGERDASVLDPIAWYGGNCGVDFELQRGTLTSGWAETQHPHSHGGTHPVGLKRPNAWGLFDMLGNVNEWCADHNAYDEDWLQPGPYGGDAQIDPLCTTGAQRVIRGGSWYSPARYLRAASRNALRPGDRGSDLGFRLALGPVQPG